MRSHALLDVGVLGNERLHVVPGGLGADEPLIQEIIHKRDVRHMIDNVISPALVVEPRLGEEVVVVFAVGLLEERIVEAHYGVINERFWLLVRQQAKNRLDKTATGAEVTVAFNESSRSIDSPVVAGGFACEDFVDALDVLSEAVLHSLRVAAAERGTPEKVLEIFLVMARRLIRM